MSQHDVTPPVPILATWNDPQLQVTFDQQLIDQILDLANWSARLANTLYVPAAANVLGDTVALVMVPDEADPGPDVVAYTAAVPDIRNLAGTPAAAFENFPIG